MALEDDNKQITKLHEIFNLQHDESRTEIAPTLEKRLHSIETVKSMLVQNANDIKDAISMDFASNNTGGRSHSETEILEFLPSIHAIKYTSKHLKKWLKPKKMPTDIMFAPSKTWARHEPLGVVGVISPWNYPLALAIIPLVDALAAGNRIILKPSELTPNFSQILNKLISERFDRSEISVIEGGLEVATAFTNLAFDHILFTGSTNVGKIVMRAAAENLTPVTLELGGKSPALILNDYDLEEAAKSISFGKFLNAGQTCIAPDYALVPQGKGEEFCKAVIRNAEKSYPNITSNEQYTAILGEKAHNRLMAALDEVSRSESAIFKHRDNTNTGNKIAPTVVLNPPNDCYLMQNEIFGPILPVIEYSNLEQAIKTIIDRPRPLAFYIFSDVHEKIEYCLDRVISGGVTINGTLLHNAQNTIPFGGIGHSGMGAYHGYEGFKRLSHLRGVHKVGFINAFEMLGPPWGKLSKMVAKIFGGIN